MGYVVEYICNSTTACQVDALEIFCQSLSIITSLTPKKGGVHGEFACHYVFPLLWLNNQYSVSDKLYLILVVTLTKN